MLVTSFAMFGKVETGFFDFRCRAQAHDGLDGVSDDRGGDHTPDDRQTDRLELVHEQAFLETLDNRIGFRVGKDARQNLSVNKT